MFKTKLVTVLCAITLAGQFALAGTKAQSKSILPLGPLSTTSQSSAYVRSENSTQKNIHLMANLFGLSTGKTDLQANLFATNRISISLGYGSKSEKERQLKKVVGDDTKVTINTNLYTVGAAYYFLDHSLPYNFIANGFAAFQKQSDAVTIKNEGGLGLKLDAMYKFNNVALNSGLQSTIIDSDSNTDFILGVGYIF